MQPALLGMVWAPPSGSPQELAVKTWDVIVEYNSGLPLLLNVRHVHTAFGSFAPKNELDIFGLIMAVSPWTYSPGHLLMLHLDRKF